MKIQVPLLICAVIGIFMVIQYFIPAARPLYERISDYTQIVYAFSIVLGVASVLHRHGGRVQRRHKDWVYSIATLASMVLMMIAGFVGGPQRGEMLFQDLFNNFLLPVQATMFSLLAFYLASASFRAFRTRSLDATVLLIAAVIVMIGRLDEGQALALPDIQRWILDGPNLVSKRAILIGVGLGMASTALKVVLGIERSYLGRSGE